MFEFIECPSCGSHDTSATPRGDSVEELECHACGTITSLQIAPPAP
jgi:translation initiation factor 2 beta subunit (eIF-2beta)/eIF-5